MFTVHFDESFKKIYYPFLHKHIMHHFAFISFKSESDIMSFQ